MPGRRGGQVRILRAAWGINAPGVSFAGATQLGRVHGKIPLSILGLRNISAKRLRIRAANADRTLLFAQAAGMS